MSGYIQYPQTGGGGGGAGVSSLNGLTGGLTLLAGTGISITPSGTFITITNTQSPGTGTVTSVGLTAPGIFTVTGSPVTTSGTLALSLNSETANTFFAAPNGSSGTPTFRAIVAADVPTLNQNTTGTASNITASSNSTLTTLPVLSLPYSQLTGVPPISGFTQGSVLFANSSGQISQDNANFYWNDANTALGIGVVPQTASVLTTQNSSGAAKPLWMFNYGTGSSTGVRGDFARGTSGSPAAAQSGDILNFMSGRGYGTSQFAAASTGVIQVVAGETFTNASNATYISFKTTPTGSVTSVEAMRINSTGNILMDTTTDNGIDVLQVGSGANVGYLKLAGSTSGTIQQQAAATTTSYTVTYPAAQGTGALTNNGSGTLSWTPGNTGTVTSVAFSDASTTPIYGITGSPVTTSGTLTQTLSTQTANTVFAGPSSGSAAQPAFRALTLADFPVTSGSSFLTSGTTYTTPSNITANTLFKFTLVGGGGGGGGTGTTSGTGGAGGGAGGSGIIYLSSLAASTGYTIAIGAAGSAGTNTPSNGGAGGNTTLTVGATTYTASGGGGGQLFATGGAAGSSLPGTGGTTTNLTVAVTGQDGGWGHSTQAAASSGNGGSPGFLGQGGAPVQNGTGGASTNGKSATGFGGAGSGGYGTGTATSGGAGTQGAILVEWSN